MTAPLPAPIGRPARITQPGPSAIERIVAVPCRGRRLQLALTAGLPLLDAVVRAFAAEGFASGTVRLAGLALAPFAYCMPALSKDGRHAAFYSETFRPSGVTRFEAGAMTLGLRDGQPFFHAHALWREAEGPVCGGHLLAEGCVIAEDVVLDAFGLDGALFRVDPDPETGFSLFGPVAAERRLADAGLERAHALRLRPNRDFAEALETFCAEHDIPAARIEGGVGSTIGAAFDGGDEVANFATEVFVADGRLAPSDGALAADLDVGLVDYTGTVASGRLLRGVNPVLMTFELVLVEEAAP